MSKMGLSQSPEMRAPKLYPIYVTDGRTKATSVPKRC